MMSLTFACILFWCAAGAYSSIPGGDKSLIASRVVQQLERDLLAKSLQPQSALEPQRAAPRIMRFQGRAAEPAGGALVENSFPMSGDMSTQIVGHTMTDASDPGAPEPADEAGAKTALESVRTVDPNKSNPDPDLEPLAEEAGDEGGGEGGDEGGGEGAFAPDVIQDDNEQRFSRVETNTNGGGDSLDQNAIDRMEASVAQKETVCVCPVAK